MLLWLVLRAAVHISPPPSDAAWRRWRFAVHSAGRLARRVLVSLRAEPSVVIDAANSGGSASYLKTPVYRGASTLTLACCRLPTKDCWVRTLTVDLRAYALTHARLHGVRWRSVKTFRGERLRRAPPLSSRHLLKRRLVVQAWFMQCRLLLAGGVTSGGVRGSPARPQHACRNILHFIFCTWEPASGLKHCL